MFDFGFYILQLVVTSVLVALALSIYLDGLGYLVFHLFGVAGIGAYTYAIMTIHYHWSPYLALMGGSIAASVCCLFISELVKSLRGDGTALATFGVGIGLFELFRELKITGGVFGLSNLPSLGNRYESLGIILWPIGIILIAGLSVAGWRRSLGGSIVAALGQDEWASISIGARLAAHQRITAVLAGFLAGAGGAYFASSIGFIEPRDFRPTALLYPLAGTIIAAGRTPTLVILSVVGIIATSQLARFFGGGAIIVGPVTEIMIALILGVAVVVIRLRGIRSDQFAFTIPDKFKG